MTDDRKQLILRFPEDLFLVLKDYKKISGMSYTSMIYNAIVWWCVKQNLLDLSYIKNNHTKKEAKKEIDISMAPPAEIMYCDSDHCEIPIGMGGPC